MPWTTIALGGTNLSHLEQERTESCVPSCLAMLAWNWKVGFGFEPQARRAGKWAKYGVDGHTPFAVFPWSDFHYNFLGTTPNQIRQLIKAYGFNHVYYQIDHSLTITQANYNCGIINNLPINDAALVADIGHAILFLRLPDGMAVLDPLGNEGTRSDWFPGPNPAPTFPRASIINPNEHAVLYNGVNVVNLRGPIRHVFHIPRQNVVTTQLKSAWQGLKTMHQYATWYLT